MNLILKRNYYFIVRKVNNNETINVQNINSNENYLTGFYDIELLTLPRQYYNNIRINQNQLTELKLPSTGLANILLPANGYGGVYLNDGDKLTEIFRFNGETNQHKLTLLPGDTLLYLEQNHLNNIFTQMKSLLKLNQENLN